MKYIIIVFCIAISISCKKEEFENVNLRVENFLSSDYLQLNIDQEDLNIRWVKGNFNEKVSTHYMYLEAERGNLTGELYEIFYHNSINDTTSIPSCFSLSFWIQKGTSLDKFFSEGRSFPIGERNVANQFHIGMKLPNLNYWVYSNEIQPGDIKILKVEKVGQDNARKVWLQFNSSLTSPDDTLQINNGLAVASFTLN